MSWKRKTGHPAFWNVVECVEMGVFKDGGGYPKGFLRWASRTLGCGGREGQVLHVCSGSVRSGVTVDIRAEVGPQVVADGLHLPFRDGSFRWVMSDPPYSQGWARELYGTNEPALKQLCNELSRVLAPGGKVGVLHHKVAQFPSGVGMKFERVYGITTGPGFRVRAWTVGRKEPAGLWG